MNHKKDIHQIIEDFIQEERNTDPNPFLSTRVMAAIGKKYIGEVSSISPLWKTAMVAASLIIAVFTGIATGSLYQSKNDSRNVVLVNDNRMENFVFYNQIGNE